MVKNEEK